MRRKNRRKSSEEGLDTKKVLYITGSVFALAVIAFVISFIMYSNKLNENATKFSKLDTNSIGTIKAEETSTSYGKTVNEIESESAQDEKENSNVNNEETSLDDDTTKIAINTSNLNNNTSVSNSKENKEESKKTQTGTEDERTTEKIPDPTFIKPVEGDIIKEFADNKLVYSSTLDVWTTHNGIDIGAEKTTVVKASAEGTVSSIKNDPRYGLTIIIEHVNGYKTIYSNLLTTEFVVEGEKVTKGQSIGTVGNTAAFEISDEPHLHFELLKDNKQQDPELYIK